MFDQCELRISVEVVFAIEVFARWYGVWFWPVGIASVVFWSLSLEIPCGLIIRMPNTVLERFLELFEERYEEPQEIVILGTFGPKPEVDICAEPRREVTIKIPNGGKEKKRKEGVRSKHIGTMFRKAAARKLTAESEDCVILD